MKPLNLAVAFLAAAVALGAWIQMAPAYDGSVILVLTFAIIAGVGALVDMGKEGA